MANQEARSNRIGTPSSVHGSKRRTEESSDRVVPLPVNPETIPEELRQRRQWVLWRFERVKSRWSKVPYIAGSNRRASSTDPATWSTFDVTLGCYDDGRADGVGYVFAADDGFAGIDLDDARDRETGEVMPWAKEILTGLNSYAEISPSGTGLKLIVKGVWRSKRNRIPVKIDGAAVGEIEVYDKARYFALTGRPVEGTPFTIEARQEALDMLRDRYFPQATNGKLAAADGEENDLATLFPLGDDEFLKLAAMQGGSKFARLWEGDIAGYPSQSEADLALVGYLVRAGADDKAVDRLFRRGGLNRDKWAPRDDYRASTIRRAREGESGRLSGYQIILDYFREHYRASFRRGTSIFSEALGREVKIGEGTAAPGIKLVDALAKAKDAPRKEGRVHRGRLPFFFSTWSKVAWMDLLAELMEEGEAVLANSSAADDLRTKLAGVLHTIVALGRHHAQGADYMRRAGFDTVVERRSLLDFCALWATEKWASIRSYQLWCKRGSGKRRLRIALRAELFGQLPKCDLAGISQAKFARRCEAFKVGKVVKVCGKRAVELAPDFLRGMVNRDDRLMTPTGSKTANQEQEQKQTRGPLS